MCSNVSLYQIAVNLENFRFWDQLSAKNIKHFGKINIRIVISIKQCTPLQDFSQFEELKIFGANFPAKEI